MKFLRIVLTGVLLCSPGVGATDGAPIHSQASRKESTWEALFEKIADDFKRIYALEDHKFAEFRWELEGEFELLREHLEDVGTLASIRETQALFKTFFRRTRDYHSDIFYRGEDAAATLPFGVRTVDRRAFVTHVDRSVASEERFPISAGDELLEFDGMPVTTALNRLILRPLNHIPTDRSDADRYLTNRPGYQGWGLPEGRIPLVFRKLSSGRVVRTTLVWKRIPHSAATLAPVKDWMLDPRAVLDEQTNRYKFIEDVDTVTSIGYRDPFVPSLGRVLWRAPDQARFFAEITRTETGTRIGFVRVPSYFPKDPVAHVREFESLMDRMQKGADVLVFDQTNNGGGSILYFYELLSRMIARPVNVPLRLRWSLQPRNYHLGKDWAELESALRSVGTDEEAQQILGDTIDGYPVDLKLARGVYREAKAVLEDIAHTDWKLSRPMHLLSIDSVRPKGRPFTKPLILLQNEWSYSAADIVPAMLQDIKRAVVFGATAPGLGAYVIGRSPPKDNRLDVWLYRLSMAEVRRANGKRPIENHGVIPDVHHDVSVRDLTGKFVDYRRKLISLAELLHRKN